LAELTLPLLLDLVPDQLGHVWAAEILDGADAGRRRDIDLGAQPAGEIRLRGTCGRARFCIDDVGDRLGGHFVYGHVDANAPILSKQPEGQGHRLRIATPPEIALLIVEKGYVTVDGVSLTVASVATGSFTVALIPETSKRTTLGVKGASDRVNLEADPIARYAHAAVAAYSSDAASQAELAWAYEI